jgi:beta-glucosidase
MHRLLKYLKRLAVAVLCLVVILAAIYYIPFPPPHRVPTAVYQTSDLKFPKDFFWGASTSSHQVEGNDNSNWTAWEKKNAARLAQEAPSKFSNLAIWPDIKAQATNPQNYISGGADNDYNLYPEDVQLMKQLGLTSYRFSIEWSRVEPQPGQFDQAAMDHYKNLVALLRQNNIEPFVTLWHRSQPVWVDQQGEWENSKTIQDYVAYVKFVTQNFGANVKYYMTFNEPALHLVGGYIEGVIPPEVKSLKRGQAAFANMMEAHRQAYGAIHTLNPDAQVGSTQAMQLGSGAPNTILNMAAASYFDNYANWKFLDGTKDTTDFIGIQYYSPTKYQVTLGGKSKVSFKTFNDPNASVKSDMGWEVYPHGIYEVITAAYNRYKKPIIVTENGIADQNDKLRAQYLADHLYWVSQAIKDGVPVKGYMVWSLLDNFEWDKGFWPRFGLVAVDYANNFKRTIRPSAYSYKQIIDNNR